VHGRMQSIAGSLLSSHLSDLSAVRGQAMSLLGQTLARGAFTGGYGEAFIALGGTLFVALCKVLLSRYASRSVDTVHATTESAPPLAAPARWRSGQSVAAAMFEAGERHAPTGFAAILATGRVAASPSAEPAGRRLGDWSKSNDHGVIAIAHRGDALCGHISGIERKPTQLAVFATDAGEILVESATPFGGNVGPDERGLLDSFNLRMLAITQHG
jgi:hypothetical protein